MKPKPEKHGRNRDTSKHANASTWRPGQSGNPNGRPRAGTAFAELGRERLDVDRIFDLVERVLNDEKIEPSARLAAVMPIVDRVFQRPVQTSDVRVNDVTRTPKSKESRAELAALLREAQATRSIGKPPASGAAEPGPTEPSDATSEE